jgi:hypothetical protein
MFTKEIVTITVTEPSYWSVNANGKVTEYPSVIHTRPINLDDALDRALIHTYRRNGCRVTINRTVQ